MLVETPYFSFDLPEGFAARSLEPACWSALNERDRREITVSTMHVNDTIGVDECLRELAALRLKDLRANRAAAHALPLELADRDDLRMSWFVTVGENPLMTFCGSVVHKDSLLGSRCVVTLCVYEYFRPDVVAQVIDTFELFAKGVLATVHPVPQRAALERSIRAPATADPSRLYPYLVPAGYLESRPAKPPTPRPIGHGLFVAFAEDFEGAARIHFAEDLTTLGTFEQLVEQTRANLARAAADRKITIRRFSGPRGLPIMVFDSDWRAASCLLLPNVRELAAKSLGSSTGYCAMAPHRDAMFVFREEDASYRGEVRDLVGKNEADGPKPLTMEVFRLLEQRVEPMTV